MRKFFLFVRWFLYITTCVLIVVAANVKISCEDNISADTLWQILLSGFITALVTVFMGPNGQEGMKFGTVKIIIHYIVLCVVMILCGYQFGWMELNPRGIVMMVVSVAVVYLLVFLAGYWLDKKRAEEINQRLMRKYGDEDQ